MFSFHTKLTRPPAIGLLMLIALSLALTACDGPTTPAATSTPIVVTATPTTKPITCTASTVPDNDPGISYTGSGWAYVAGPDYSVWDNNDFHTTLTKGDSFSYTFTGTGVVVNSATNVDYGLTSFSIDNTLVPAINFYSSPARYGAAFPIAMGLPCGTHTIKGVVFEDKRFSLDSLAIIG